MTPQSAKSKGRRFQQKCIKMLVDILDIHPEDLESRGMGGSGEDLIMARAAREKFPYSVECKNKEKMSFWSDFKQSQANCGKYAPILLAKKNRTKPIALLLKSDFMFDIPEDVTYYKDRKSLNFWKAISELSDDEDMFIVNRPDEPELVCIRLEPFINLHKEENNNE